MLKSSGLVRLQGVGMCKGTPAKDLKIGNHLVWNFGYEYEVTNINFSKTGKTLKITEKNIESGEEFERRLGSERLVVVLKEA